MCIKNRKIYILRYACFLMVIPILTKKDILAFNQKFDAGFFKNESSLDYALSNLKRNIAWTRKLAYLIRAILIDHVFEEGNKRTTCAVLLFYVDHEGYEIEEKKAVSIIKTILLKNITSIEKTKMMIEDAVTKKD